jgi:AcrR family transcriptional regulator
MPMAVPARLTRAEQQARTRAALLDAAGRVFVERGFAGSSVEAIAAEAGYTRGAFYSNFASKEELFCALLQDRVYAYYRRLAERIVEGERPSARTVGERLASVQADRDGSWLFRLWLELLAHVDRDPSLRALAQEFWKGNRALSARAIEGAYRDAGLEPRIAPERLATASIAMDIGLALQHYVDPDAVPLGVYPEIWDALFSLRG